MTENVSRLHCKVDDLQNSLNSAYEQVHKYRAISEYQDVEKEKQTLIGNAREDVIAGR